jgi:hypothetical protein
MIVGDVFSVDIRADMGPTWGWGLDVTFDQTLMELLNVSTTGWSQQSSDGDGLGGTVPHVPGFDVSGSNVYLATLHFSCLGVGLSSLDLSVTPGDDREGFWGPHPTNLPEQYFHDWSYSPGKVTQSPVPAPTTMVLLVSSLIGLAGLRKNFRKK